MKDKLQTVFLISFFVIIGTIGAVAQNMSGTVKIFDVKFPLGKYQTTVRGTASYAMSYVYKFKVKKGQNIFVKTISKETELTFSAFEPDSETELAFVAKEWSGVAKKSGTYLLTLVMNNKTEKRVPYSLTIQIK